MPNPDRMQQQSQPGVDQITILTGRPCIQVSRIGKSHIGYLIGPVRRDVP
jgi:hypothetical protein